MNFYKRTRRAFSWLEVLIVVAVLGVATAVFVPLSKKMTHETRISVIEGQMKQMAVDGRAFVIAKGLRRTTYSNLVKEKVFAPAESILGETYDHLIFEHVGGVLTVYTAEGESVSIRY